LPRLAIDHQQDFEALAWYDQPSWLLHRLEAMDDLAVGAEVLPRGSGNG
jgi:hypothetical protein